MIADQYHVPVLAHEVVRYLLTRPSGTYVDGTLGGGGHTERILTNLSGEGRVIAFDRDDEAIASSGQRLDRFGGRVTFVRDSFSNVGNRVAELGFGPIDGVLLDLGISSHQIDTQERGFSFQREGKIDMRMDRSQSLDGWTVVNRYDEARLADVIWRFGEERNSRRIARRLAERRKERAIDSTTDLASIVASCAKGQFASKTVARVFQAIRIEVNNELDQLASALAGAMNLLTAGGRLVVISYHSLEDRIVKEFFINEARTFIPSGTKLLPDRPVQPRARVLTRKPVLPDENEITSNPRARSAKLRAAEKI